MIVKTACFVIGEDHRRIFPARALHQGSHQAVAEVCTFLDVFRSRVVHGRVLIEAGVGWGFDPGDLGEISGGCVGGKLRHRNQVLTQRRVVYDCLTVAEHLQITAGIDEKALRACVIGRAIADGFGGRLDVDPPGDAGVLQNLKNRWNGQWTLIVRIASAERVGVSLRSSRHHIHPIRLGARHGWREEAIRGCEVRRHEVIEIQVAGIGGIARIAAIVIAHGAVTVGIEERRLILPGVVGGGLHEPIELGGIFSHGIVVIPVDVAFIPRGARILDADAG